MVLHMKRFIGVTLVCFTLLAGMLYMGYLLPHVTLRVVIGVSLIASLGIFFVGFCIRHLAKKYVITSNGGVKVDWLELALSPLVLLVLILLVF